MGNNHPLDIPAPPGVSAGVGIKVPLASESLKFYYLSHFQVHF